MADTTLLDVGATSQFQEAVGAYENTVWLDQDIGYRFSIDSTSATLRLVYQKTTTGPTGFGAAVQAGSVDSVRRFAIWWDQWTEGDSGTKIHFAFVEGINNDCRYRNLDTATDTLSTAVQVFNGASVDAAAQLSQGACAIGKVASNLLVIHARLDNDGENVDRYSTDGGSTWNTHTASVFGSNTSSVHYLGNYSATEYAMLHLNRADGVVTLKRMATSSVVSTSATLATLTVDDGYHAMSGSQRWSDGAFLINYVTSQSVAAATFGATEVAADGTVTAKTNVKSNVEMSQNVSTFIDQNSDRWYVAYTSGTAAGSVIAVYAYSDDGGTTWTVDQAYGETTDTIAGISAGYCTPLGSVGRFSPSFYNRDLLDVLINTGVLIELAFEQVSYRVRIYDDALMTTLIYDSGVVTSATKSHSVPDTWGGEDLEDYFIEVTVVDENLDESVSALSKFTLDYDVPAPDPIAQVTYRVRIYEADGTTVVYDSGVVASATLSHAVPGTWAGVDLDAYNIEVTVVDSFDDESVSPQSDFTLDLPNTPPPTITSIDPDNGPVTGGTAFTITGTDFAAGATVTFDGVEAANVSVDSATEITGDTPVGLAGLVDVAVVDPTSGTDTLVDGFEYTAVVIPPPAVAVEDAVPNNPHVPSNR